MNRQLPPELQAAQKDILGIVKDYGLDCFDVLFECVTYDEINEIAAMGGFPTRYPHWRFGMDYDYLNKGYTWGLQKIYELVINTDPCYAYLQMGNEIVDQKLVMAHVYGHCDFFKNNLWFSKTNRKMLDEMANHATRIREYQDKYGVEEVEDFIDSCLSIDNLIDIYSPFVEKKEQPKQALAESQEEIYPSVARFKSKEYLENYLNPEDYIKKQKDKITEQQNRRSFPAEPQRDILKFLIDHAPLQKWEREILSIIREEAYYFAPQGQTKIMNEGWASYWHAKIMTEHVLNDSEIIDFADHHAGTVTMQPGQMNPYKIGIELFRHIEERWNKGKFGKEFDECDDIVEKVRWDKKLDLGREKIFEVRQVHNDVTFLDSYMDEEFCEKLKLFVYGFNRRTGQYEIMDRDWRKVKNQMLQQMTNFGNPLIEIEDANFENRGELLLMHRHQEGMDLDHAKTVLTLEKLFLFWKRPVNIYTKFNSQGKLLTYDGKELKEKDYVVKAA